MLASGGLITQSVSCELDSNHGLECWMTITSSAVVDCNHMHATVDKARKEKGWGQQMSWGSSVLWSVAVRVQGWEGGRCTLVHAWWPNVQSHNIIHYQRASGSAAGLWVMAEGRVHSAELRSQG